MKTKIMDLVDIRPGIFLHTAAHGSIRYLQPSHFFSDGTMEARVKPTIPGSDKHAKHLLRKGDVLLAAKSHRNFAIVFDVSIGPAIASSAFIVLSQKRANDSLILAEYLAWILMHPKTQSILKTLATGTALPTLSITALQTLELEVPPMNVQHKIISIDRLHANQQKLRAQLDELQDRLLEKQLLDIVQR